ncbi:kinase-like protein [Apiospora rasikravindrae]|uniref:Kinase-like protein n=1 Tax=Apiospora rasikravindrae TaxID=990691 RepID=A0ABR1TET1_9PEZI
MRILVTQVLIPTLKKHFRGRQNGLKFRRIIGQGAFGVTALLHDVRKEPPKQFIIKRALRADAVDDLRLEIQALRRFRGAAHITQLASYRDRGLNDRGKDNKEIPGPYIIMDYLENGTFKEFFERCVAGNIRVPNRVLWYIMLCFIRSCVALAWPPKGEQGAKEELEDTYIINGNPGSFAHNDMHMGNVMFGGLEPDVDEHSIVPPLKLIDFGLAGTRDRWPRPVGPDNFNAYQGLPSNVKHAATMMMKLITGYGGRLSERSVDMPVTVPDAKGNAKTIKIPTQANLLWQAGAHELYPYLDELLRQLIGDMMATYYANRPFLKYLLDTALEAVRTRRSSDYHPNIQNEETGRAMREFVKRFFLDAQAP